MIPSPQQHSLVVKLYPSYSSSAAAAAWVVVVVVVVSLEQLLVERFFIC
jgi:hypothetical protein